MKGMTWDHPRGYDPLAAAAEEWRARTGTRIEWERRSLQDFESYPVEELARRYDLIVIDHPHVGQVGREEYLVPLDMLLSPQALAPIRAGSIGGSYESYTWNGRQWALPIDAAAQVQAWVPGRIVAPVARWSELSALAAQGRVAIPLRSPHALMSLFTLCGLAGVAVNPDGPDLFPAEADWPLALLSRLAAAVDPACYGMDPIAVLEEMASASSRFAVAPLIYGYVSYAQEGFRPALIAFSDLPAVGVSGPTGSTLGGTGIAVSAMGSDARAAAEFALWVAGGEVQRGLYAGSGGQPAHADAWNEEAVNRPILDFYRATRATLDAAWVRPRHDGYMDFQGPASDRLSEGLRRGEPASSLLAALNALYRETL